MLKRVRVIVSGRVQGVWYRASTCDRAAELGVNGYVRNLPNGDVEFIAEGEEDRVNELIEWARRGPEGARVDKVEAERLPGDRDFNDFRIRP
jgi:acylphosphatase